jgi:hypothetical protein
VEPNEVRAELVPLSEARPLTARERELIDFLLAGRPTAALQAQAESAQVSAICSCGCPSVRLVTDERLPRARYPLPVKITAYQPKTRAWTEVALHIVEGRLHELEIWGETYGVRPRVDPTKLIREETSTGAR